MFQATDNDKLSAIMDESPENKEVISKLLEAHRLQISAISHEIRNPLSLVYSSIQLIEADHPEVRSYRHWAQMREDVEYMTRLLEELSSYNNGEWLNLTATGMTSWLRTLALSFAASLIDTPVEFVSRIDPDLPVLPIDQVKFRQALSISLEMPGTRCLKVRILLRFLRFLLKCRHPDVSLSLPCLIMAAASRRKILTPCLNLSSPISRAAPDLALPSSAG